MIDLYALGREAEAGLPLETDRRDRARVNIDFYEGRFDPYPSHPPGGTRKPPKIRRTSLYMQRVVNVLTEHLYANGPAREFPDEPELSAWLQAQYARGGLNSLIQEADRFALAADVAAIQVVGSGNPEHPIRFMLWAADSFAVWCDPAEPAVPLAVATIDVYDNTRRIRIWTDETVLTYQSEKLEPGQTAGGTTLRLTGSDENYYRVIPFAFIHVKLPTTQFWTNGPGDHLRQVNEGLNFAMTEAGEVVRFSGKPIITVFGSNSSPPSPSEPGDIWYLKATANDVAGNGIPPSVDTLAPDLGCVDVAWADANSYIDHSLGMIGVPTGAVRMVQSAARSGVSIVTEQLPLICWAMGRKSAFTLYEQRLARVAIAVAAAELARLGGSAPATLDPSRAETLAIRWPSLVPDVPLVGQARTQDDSTKLALGQISRVQLVMRDFNLTREQALAHLQAVADDLKAEQAMGLPPIPAPQTTNPKTGTTDAQD